MTRSGTSIASLVGRLNSVFPHNWIGFPRRDEAVEGLGVAIDKVQQLCVGCLAFFGLVAEFLPPVIPAAFVARKVGNHRAEGGAQGTDGCAYGAAARSRRLRGRFLDETT